MSHRDNRDDIHRAKKHGLMATGIGELQFNFLLNTFCIGHAAWLMPSNNKNARK